MPGIERSLNDYVQALPHLKFLFFGGKGGVGKTVMAGATALELAGRGKRTLLASTNPVHSLSGLLDQNVYGKPVAVTGVDNLWAYEIDTKEPIQPPQGDVKPTIRRVPKLPEALPIAVIKRFIQWFHDFGIPVGGIVVNMLIQKDQLQSGSPDFVKNRVAMQDAYMEEIWRDFDGAVRAIIPLFDNEVRGVASLRKVLPYAFAARSSAAS